MLKKQGLTILHSLPTVIVPSCFSVQFVIFGWKLEILCPVDTVIEADASNFNPWKWADLSFWLAGIGASLIAQLVKNPPSVQEIPVWFLGQENLLEKDSRPTPVSLGFACCSAGKEFSRSWAGFEMVVAIVTLTIPGFRFLWCWSCLRWGLIA